MTTVLAIDQGTSGTKAVVVDSGGVALATAEVSVRPRYLDGGGVEQDPEAVWESVLTAGRSAVASAGVPIEAVALANQGESVLAWQPATGRALTPIIGWQDRRAESLCLERGDHAQWVHARTGLELDPYFSAPKLRWVRDHLTTEGVVTTTDTWLVSRLCGAFVTDLATASRSLLVEIGQESWSSALVDLFGLGAEEMPAIVANDQSVGETTVFGSPAPVAGLIVDQQGALLAQGCLDPGMAKCTYGTGAFVLAQTGRRTPRSTSGLTSSVAWRLRGATSYCLDGQVYTAASAVRWAVDLGLLAHARDLDTVAAEASEGVLFVPAFAGLAAPWWDPSGAATMAGLRLGTGPGQIVRALIEGIAAQVAEVTALIGDDLGEPLSRLRVDGGLTRSATLMQAQADIAQVPVEVYPSPHATPLGAAACARLALAPSRGAADEVGGWRPARTYEPQWSRDRAESFRQSWRTLADGSARQRSSR